MVEELVVGSSVTAVALNFVVFWVRPPGLPVGYGAACVRLGAQALNIKETGLKKGVGVSIKDTVADGARHVRKYAALEIAISQGARRRSPRQNALEARRSKAAVPRRTRHNGIIVKKASKTVEVRHHRFELPYSLLKVSLAHIRHEGSRELHWGLDVPFACATDGKPNERQCHGHSHECDTHDSHLDGRHRDCKPF